MERVGEAPSNLVTVIRSVNGHAGGAYPSYPGRVSLDEPVRGSFAYLEQPGLFSVPPVEQLRLFIEGRLPAPPLTHLSGLVVEDASEGTTTWSIPASPRWRTAAGVFAGGTLSFVADAALAGAVFTKVPTGTMLLSSDLSMNFLAPAQPSSEKLIARGTIIDVGRRQGLSEARVEDAHGTLLAHATSRCVLQPMPFDPPPAPEAFAPVEPAGFDTPDPYLRPDEGEVIPQEERDEVSGLDLVHLWSKGDRPNPPTVRCSDSGSWRRPSATRSWRCRRRCGSAPGSEPSTAGR